MRTENSLDSAADSLDSAADSLYVWKIRYTNGISVMQMEKSLCRWKNRYASGKLAVRCEVSLYKAEDVRHLVQDASNVRQIQRTQSD